jgi:hypothetical protein
MSISCCFVRPSASALLLVACLLSPTALNAQDISEEGVARSASAFSALVSHCQKSYFIDVAEAKKYQQVFVNVGTKTFGKEKFEKLLAKEMKRRLAEVKATGAAQWCAYQKSHIQQTGNGKLFEKPAANVGANADEMAMLLATLVVAQDRCGLQTRDLSLNALVAKRGFDVKAFLPDGVYASVVETKIKKAKEFIEQLGSREGCKGINDTVRKFLPEVVLTEDNQPPPAE